MGATAQLIADGGAAAESDDFFRSREFLAAERTTHTLRVASPGREARVPLIVRAVEGGDALDATSPYGYPGGLVEGDGPAPDPASVDWSRTGLVSVFGRERLAAEPWIAGPRQRSRVLVHDPARPRALRTRLAEQVRANARDGWAIERHDGPESPAADRDGFAAAYRQTMRRADAASHYFFAREYFDAILGYRASWLILARRQAQLGAGAIVAASDGVLHYYLGATAESARAASPFKNVVAAMLDLADELGLPLNLGGGVVAGDGLETFKRGFANSELPFHTQELVCEPRAYDRLTAGRRASGFFPAYRA